MMVLVVNGRAWSSEWTTSGTEGHGVCGRLPAEKGVGVRPTDPIMLFAQECHDSVIVEGQA